MPIPHGLAHGDDVRHDTIKLETPKMPPEASEAGLDLVGYTQATCRASLFIQGAEIALRRCVNAVAGEARVQDKHRWPVISI